jgi:hypothetical protein
MACCGVLQASTEFSTAFTPFTLANFSSAISVNITNLNKTSVVPAGARTCLHACISLFRV